MTVKAVFLRSAETDLKELRGYVVKHFGKDTWQETYSKIKQSVALIESHPTSGKIPEELATLNLNQYRQILSGMNRIIYEVRGDTAYIHIVCDTRKDLRSLLMRRILRVN
ncbi:type II toxin-antitoxin system RelE/ParE family toxin [Burkholderia multivorans]|uniref:type II toxin-antitoxin system RelE/ParE family toxin n=1 Tax=Burkholderia multivorans TaxID=87883 RepID=UPI001C221B14|nr:type II toxin-antitoxin system RelE/ParE family toxin [Burkholderia multivorans]MBU9434153.1 type II toxin-antitoxin system RelE/ParE family toxin [Burkholderia multivorans]MCA8452711.1 type II toxin-antitoxin system RelE/ParE family toxin [Burkholderia multivorans]MDN8018958.1 type II toxin-antitoxin system RelE/ParE family toxin [Burkholderia multivorans]